MRPKTLKEVVEMRPKKSRNPKQVCHICGSEMIPQGDMAICPDCGEATVRIN